MTLLRTIRAKLVAAFLLVVLLSIGGLAVYLSAWTDHYYVNVLKGNLERESFLIGDRFMPMLADHSASVDATAKQSGQDLAHRITIVRADGTVLGDSEHDPATMENHSDRPEVRLALSEGSGWSVRRSSTLGTRWLYVASRIGDAKHPVGVARVAQSLEQVDAARAQIYGAFGLAGLVIFVIVALVSAKMATSISEPIARIRRSAQRIAQGEFGSALPVRTTGRDEVDELADSMNKMSGELQATLAELRSEHAKLQAIHDKTDDGLLVVDDKSRVQMANPAALRVLGQPLNQVLGKTIIECSLSHDLAELVTRVLNTRQPASLEVTVGGPKEVFLNAYLTPLDTPQGAMGTVIVLHDLTAAKRIDSVRRDFVANVSHELRTPLASIRAMAETILLRNESDPNAATTFSKQIMAEADRLTAVSEDLLDLAKIEAGRRTLSFEEVELAEVAAKLVDDLAVKARPANVELVCAVAPDLKVRADRGALVQILTNLMDNAIRFTPAGGSVTVSADSDDEATHISVIDTGVGIPASDLPRVFERFYRVDRARSRATGGTGLGLAIVRHLAESHGGRVTVQSEVGTGSTFTVHLPHEAA